MNEKLEILLDEQRELCQATINKIDTIKEDFKSVQGIADALGVEVEPKKKKKRKKSGPKKKSAKKPAKAPSSKKAKKVKSTKKAKKKSPVNISKNLDNDKALNILKKHCGGKKEIGFKDVTRLLLPHGMELRGQPLYNFKFRNPKRFKNSKTKGLFLVK